MIVNEEVPGIDVYRIARERFWINRLGTFGEENKKR